MTAAGLAEWGLFLALAALAVAGALGMIFTMSMYRAGLVLMVSFVAIAGLFVLLDAELLAIIQIMMNVAGMLMMILFMVMLMMDPGGEMMWEMKRSMALPGPGALSMRMPGREAGSADASAGTDATPAAPAMSHSAHGVHPGTVPDGTAPERAAALGGAAAQLTAPERTADAEAVGHGAMDGTAGMGDMGDMGGMAEMTPAEHRQMMVDMAMSTEQLPLALLLGTAVALALVILVVATPWPAAAPGTPADAAGAVGGLMLTKYMLAFEGAALLILAGIAGGVILGRRERALAGASQVEAARTAAAEMMVGAGAGTAHEGAMHEGAMHEGAMQDVVKQEVVMRDTQSTGAPAPDAEYTCPMHPEVRSPTPGVCPKCGMTLVPVRSPGAPDARGAAP